MPEVEYKKRIDAKSLLVFSISDIGFDFCRIIQNSDHYWDNIVLFTSNKVYKSKEITPIKVVIVEEFKYKKGSDISHLITNEVKKYSDPFGFVIGWPLKFTSELINHFDGNLFNYHAGDLPEYRGAGGFSWQVLTNQNFLKGFIHELREDIDSGPILLEETKLLSTEKPLYPIDFINAFVELREKLCIKFTNILKEKFIKFDSVDQAEKYSTYFPRLSTEQNGFIDFSWSVSEADRFIRAFGNPYIGAAFRYKDQLFRCRVVSHVEFKKLHPYIGGLIIRKSSDTLYIAFHDGIIGIAQIFFEEKEVDTSTFTLGSRVYNDFSDLDNSKKYRPWPENPFI